MVNGINCTSRPNLKVKKGNKGYMLCGFLNRDQKIWRPMYSYERFDLFSRFSQMFRRASIGFLLAWKIYIENGQNRSPISDTTPAKSQNLALIDSYIKIRWIQKMGCICPTILVPSP